VALQKKKNRTKSLILPLDSHSLS